MSLQPEAREVTLHASCVALKGRGVLIVGPSGAGKSALALQLMAFGAELVADDQTRVRLQNGELQASCPEAIRGLIEARGVGILRHDAVAAAPLVLAVDLGQSAHERLPPRRKFVLLGQEIDLVQATQSNHFPAAIICYLQGARQD